jgi:hypothetical protein
MYTEMLSQGLAVVSCIDPDAYAAAAYNGDAVDLSKFSRALFIVMAGDLGSSATLDYKLQGSVTGSSGWTDLSGKAITQLTEAGTDSNKQAIIEITAEELQEFAKSAGAAYRYVRDVMTVGTAASDCGAIGLAGGARFHPASDDNLASVDEIVT